MPPRLLAIIVFNVHKLARATNNRTHVIRKGKAIATHLGSRQRTPGPGTTQLQSPACSELPWHPLQSQLPAQAM
jgi:hypothetical protein